MRPGRVRLAQTADADCARLPRPLCESCGLSRPGVGRVVACGVGVAWWVCGRAVPGLCRPVRGPPENRGPGSPHQRTGVDGAALGWLWAALRGWAALACLRASPRPFSRPSWRGPQPGPPRDGPRRPSRPPRRGAAWCFPSAASPRFSPPPGQGDAKRPGGKWGTRLRARGVPPAAAGGERPAHTVGRKETRQSPSQRFALTAPFTQGGLYFVLYHLRLANSMHLRYDERNERSGGICIWWAA